MKFMYAPLKASKKFEDKMCVGYDDLTDDKISFTKDKDILKNKRVLVFGPNVLGSYNSVLNTEEMLSIHASVDKYGTNFPSYDIGVNEKYDKKLLNDEYLYEVVQHIIQMSEVLSPFKDAPVPVHNSWGYFNKIMSTFEVEDEILSKTGLKCFISPEINWQRPVDKKLEEYLETFYRDSDFALSLSILNATPEINVNITVSSIAGCDNAYEVFSKINDIIECLKY